MTESLPPATAHARPSRAAADSLVGSARGRRRGFTLIELMVVILILVILVAIVAVGLSGVFAGTADRTTRATLESLNTMLANYATADAARGASSGNAQATRLPAVVKANPDASVQEYYSTRDALAGAGAGIPPLPPVSPPLPDSPMLTAPDPSAAAPYLGSDPTRFPAMFAEDNWVIEPAVARTQAVIRRLIAVEANDTVWRTLPEQQKSGSPAAGFNGAASLLRRSDAGAAASPLDPPLPMDAYGNPILYVPPTGITGLAFKDGTRLGLSGNQWRVLRAKGGGAFWMSAGADGLIAGSPGPDGAWGTADDVPGADDNLYSTEIEIVVVPTTP